MLTDLEITDLGIIDHVHLRLGPGLNVLSGETGAGKTMVVSGLQWLLGGRADKDKVRTGARVAVVQARLAGVPASAAGWTDDHDEALIVQREVGARAEGTQPAGRSLARIGGRMAPVSSLVEVLSPVVEIHSQHESMRLAEASVQRALLDRFGGDAIAKARGNYDTRYQAWTAAVTALTDAEAIARDGAREADRLRFEVDEISAVAPQPGEEDTLDADIARMEHIESLRRGTTVALEALNDEEGARDRIGVGVASLREVVGHDEALRDPLGRLESALAEVQEVAIDLATYVEDLAADPDALDVTLTRRAAIGALLRKFGPSTADVLAYLAQSETRLALIDGGEERLAELAAAERLAHEAVLAAGATLRIAREEAGHALAEAIDAHLTDLAMPDARMAIAVTEDSPGEQGADHVEFLLSANRGQPALPLGRAASGGERSRVALALRVALADADDTPVMIFDEVDAGIGGETALAVGRKLAALAASRQVICVTHLAQLAAFADTHFVVAKATEGDTTTTSVQRLTTDQRPEELARMLSGAADSDAARTHAAELLRVASS